MKMWRGESPLFRNCHTGRPLVAHQHCCQQFKPRWSQKLWRSWWWWFIFWQWQSPLSLTPSVKATCDSGDGTKHPSLCDSDPKQEICDQQEKESFCSNQLAPHPLSPSKSTLCPLYPHYPSPSKSPPPPSPAPPRLHRTRLPLSLWFHLPTPITVIKQLSNALEFHQTTWKFSCLKVHFWSIADASRKFSMFPGFLLKYGFLLQNIKVVIYVLKHWNLDFLYGHHEIMK